MTRDEVKGLLMVIVATYPNFNITDKSAAINSWYFFLQDYDTKDIQAALKTYVATSNSAFAPTASQLIGTINKVNELTELSEVEAWSLVSKAIRNSGYHSQEEYERLPEEVKKAVGSPNQLYQWATDADYNEGVVMSLFQRNYRTALNRSHEVNQLPPEVRLQMKERLQIGTTDDVM